MDHDPPTSTPGLPPRIQQARRQSHELLRGKVLHQKPIQTVKALPQLRLRGEDGSRVGVAGSHAEGGADPVARDIRYGDHDAAIVYQLPVEVVAARLIGRLVPAAISKPSILGGACGRYPC